MKYNVILITVDSLRADRLSCLGYHRKSTPNLDDMAAKGCLFTEAVSVGSNTRISFPALFASIYPFILLHLPDKGYMHLPREYQTITEVLHNHGYNTLAFNSNPLLTYYREYGRGFDIYDDPLYERKRNRFSSLVRNALHFCAAKIKREPFLPYPSPELVNKRALSFLKDVKRPFFLWVNHMSIHVPYFPPIKFLEEMGARQISYSEMKELNRKIKDKQYDVNQKDVSDIADLYDAEVRNVDHYLGEFVEHLAEIGVNCENTYFIITSDHGDELREHGGLAHFLPKLYEELLRVPLIITGPNLKAGRIERQVSTLHLAPTILSLNDVSKPDYYMGDDLTPLMQRKATDIDEYVISEGCEKGKSPDEPRVVNKQLSCRSHHWKYIYHADEREELYNLQSDPHEQSNIVGKEPNRAKELKQKILAHMAMEEKEAHKLMEMRRIKRSLSSARLK